MIIYALVSELSSVTLWGLSPEQRIRRQLEEIRKELKGDITGVSWLDEAHELPKHGPLDSWLSEDNVATGRNARSYSIFGST